MERNQVLGMIAGYYLSRFDSAAYQMLALGNKGETHEALGRAFGVPKESIRNWRDEFDPVHENPRNGWHNRQMRPSRLQVLEKLARFDQQELHQLITAATLAPSGAEASRLLSLAGDLDEAG